MMHMSTHTDTHNNVEFLPHTQLFPFPIDIASHSVIKALNTSIGNVHFSPFVSLFLKVTTKNTPKEYLFKLLVSIFFRISLIKTSKSDKKTSEINNVGYESYSHRKESL